MIQCVFVIVCGDVFQFVCLTVFGYVSLCGCVDGGRTTHIGVDFAVAHGKGAVLVQQHATEARALVAVLLFLCTAGNRGVGLDITAMRERRTKPQSVLIDGQLHSALTVSMSVLTHSQTQTRRNRSIELMKESD